MSLLDNQSSVDGLETIKMQLTGTSESIRLWSKLLELLQRYARIVSFTYQINEMDSSLEIRIQSKK